MRFKQQNVEPGLMNYITPNLVPTPSSHSPSSKYIQLHPNQSDAEQCRTRHQHPLSPDIHRVLKWILRTTSLSLPSIHPKNFTVSVNPRALFLWRISFSSLKVRLIYTNSRVVCSSLKLAHNFIRAIHRSLPVCNIPYCNVALMNKHFHEPDSTLNPK